MGRQLLLPRPNVPVSPEAELLYEKLDQLERPEAPARKVVAPEARLFDYDYEGNWINFGSYEDDIP